MQEELKKANSYALTLLGFRSYSLKGLEKRLREKGFRCEVIEHVLQNMLNYGYLNDEIYARNLVELRIRRGIGKQRLYQELLNKGIDSTLAETVLADISLTDELIQAKTIAQKKLFSLNNKNDTKVDKYRKLAQFLYRKGFSTDIICKVLEEIFSL